MAEHAQEVATSAPLTAAVLEKVLIGGDLKDLSKEERVKYYAKTCESLGLNPLTRPFQYITLNGRLTLYATRDATDQLRASRKVSISIVSREKVGDVFTVTARATMPDGRCDESIGAVSIGKLTGDALANALMKTETKAKRRVTLSIVGLGWLDETEIETIPGAKVGEPGEVAKLSLVDESPAKPEADISYSLLDQGESVAREGTFALQEWWMKLKPSERKMLASHKEEWKDIAKGIDDAGAEV